jgi:nickel-dependent lactate racemase
MLFNMLAELLADADIVYGVLVALGTHPAMSQKALRKHLGLTPDMERRIPVMNHAWDDPASLTCLGMIKADRVSELTNGLMRETVELVLNRAILDYDHLLICSPVFPHEVAGFSGGSKYLFPGISGHEMIDATHWLGALETNMKTIGRFDTPVRRLLDEGARRVGMPVTAACFVVVDGGMSFLSIGELPEAWRVAAEESARHHIVRKPRRYRRVLSCAPDMYDDLWTGGKCMYKVEPVVEDGGEILIYAPHIASLSVTHGRTMAGIGYHVRDYFVQQMDRFADVPRAIMAVSTYLKGSGTYENGVETPRVRVSIASAISREECEQVGLGYTDPAMIDVDAWKGHEDKGLLVVEKAGETLYLPEEVRR